MLLRHRVAVGLTQQELAQRAAVSIRTLRDIEQGRVLHPRPQSLQRLAAALELSEVDSDALLEAATGRRVDSRLRVGVLGPLTVYHGPDPVDVYSPMQRSLIGLLALHPGRAVSYTEIIDTLWGQDPPKSCATLVHVYVRQIRGLLEPQRLNRERAQVVVRSGSAYELSLDGEQLDLALFQKLLVRARQQQSANEPKAAYESLENALRCWRGPVLANADTRLRHHPTAIATSQRRLAAALSFADIALDLGRYATAKELLLDLAADEPLHEGLHTRLMLSLAGCGDQAAALRLFADIRARLADELGVEPGTEIQDAYVQILRQRPPADAEAADTAPAALHLPMTPQSKTGSFYPPAQLPPDVYGFVGRTEYLERLDAIVKQQDAAATALPIAVIAGAPAVGKTALAVHWAHQATDRFPDGQLYVNLRAFGPAWSAVNPAEAVRGFLEALGVPPHQIPVELAAQTALYRSLLAGKRMLVLLDNASDAEQIRPLLPGAPECMVLVTTRSRLDGLVAAEGAQPLDLDLLTADEARELLIRRIGRERVSAESHAVDDVISRCAGLPLALAVVAARSMQSTYPLALLADELRESSGNLDAFGGDDAVTDVRVVFSWSYQALSHPAARLFRLLGLHPGQDITASAAASLAGVPREQARDLLTELDRAHLVSQQAPGRFELHDLLRAYADELVNSVDADTARRSALHRILDHYLHSAKAAVLTEAHRDQFATEPAQLGVIPEDFATSSQAMAWFDAEHPALLAAVHRAAATGFTAHVWQLAWTLVDFYDRRGRWQDWVVTQQAALEAARLLADRPREAHTHRSLARAYAQLHRYDHAHSHLKLALDLCRDLGDHAGQAKTHGTIGILWGMQGQQSQALGHAQQALDLFRSAGHQVGQAKALNQVGWYHAELGDYTQALRYCRQALALQQSIGEHDGEADTWDSLGYVHHHLGDREQAVICYRRAVDLYRELGSRFDEADTLIRLGDTHQASSDIDAAHDAWRRAMMILDDLGHPNADQVRARLHDVDRRGGSD